MNRPVMAGPAGSAPRDLRVGWSSTPDGSVLAVRRVGGSFRRWLSVGARWTVTDAGQTFSVRFDPGSIAARAYRTDVAEERYYCSFRLNPDFVAPLAEAGLVVTGTDQDGEPRVIELRDHPFAVGTLFVPQVRSTPEHPHPLVLAFVEATVSLP